MEASLKQEAPHFSAGRMSPLPKNRERLGLSSFPSKDPDQVAGRMDGNINNNRIMYGVDDFGNFVSNNNFLDAVNVPEKLLSSLETETNGFKIIGTNGKTAWSVAGNQYNSKYTLYIFPDGTIRRGDELDTKSLDHLPDKTNILLGYVYGGKVSRDRTLWSITGNQWNYPTTKYRLPDKKFVNGDDLDSKSVPKGTIVLFRD